MIAGAGRSQRLIARVRAAVLGFLARKPSSEDEQPAAQPTKRERRLARARRLAMTWSRRSSPHPLAVLREQFIRKRNGGDDPASRFALKHGLTPAGWASAKKQEARRRAGLLVQS